MADHQHRAPVGQTGVGSGAAGRGATPGKRTLTERLVQPKLRVGAADSAHELEADRAADRIASGAPAGPLSPVSTDEAARAVDGAGARAPGALDTGLVERAAETSAGAPLPDGVRGKMEAGYGRELGGVRVHTGGDAGAAARSIDASSFAVGQNIYFADGEYRPGTPGGDHLIAHEVAHTIQQGGPGAPAQRKLVQRNPGRGQAGPAECPPGDDPALPAPARPERTSLYITGRYEGMGGQTVTMQLNQAGHAVDGALQIRSTTRDDGARMDHRRFSGQLPDDGAGAQDQELSFACTVRDTYRHGGDYAGHASRDLRLTARRGRTAQEVQVSVQVDGQTHRMQRTSGAPNVSDEAIHSVPEAQRALAEASQHAPLDRRQEQRITSYCRGGGFLGLLDTYFDAPGHSDPQDPESVERMAAGNRVNRSLMNLFEEFPHDQHPLVQRRIHDALQAPLPGRLPSRTVWNWLQIMAMQSTQLGQVRDKLGLTGAVVGHGAVADNAPQHHYRWMVALAGGDVRVIEGVSVMFGLVRIEKGRAANQAQPPGDHNWQRVAEGWNYQTVRAGAFGGFSAGMNIAECTTWGYFSTPFEWAQADFLGSYTSIGGGASGAFGAGTNLEASTFTFNGSGAHPPLTVDSGGTLTLGISFGVGMTMNVGWLELSTARLIDHLRQRARGANLPAQSARPRTGGFGATHFPTNGHELTPEGLDAVRALCASHRAVLEAGRTLIRIDAHASRLDDDCHNQALTERRAEYTAQAMRDCMVGTGGARRLFARIQAVGHGETEAQRRHRADGNDTREEQRDDSMQDRRVEIRIDGSLLLTLR